MAEATNDYSYQRSAGLNAQAGIAYAAKCLSDSQRDNAAADQISGYDAESRMHMAWLKNRIEAMSEQQPMWSKSAYTHRRTAHVSFVNGEAKAEGHTALAAYDVGLAAEQTLAAVRAEAAKIPEPHVIVWRKEPVASREGGNIRVECRLSIETDPCSGVV